jgi:hypothetical protein
VTTSCMDERDERKRGVTLIRAFVRNFENFSEAVSPRSEVCSLNISRLYTEFADWSVHDPNRNSTTRSFDHLVGAQQERFRDRQPERLGSRQIDAGDGFGVGFWRGPMSAPFARFYFLRGSSAGLM